MAKQITDQNASEILASDKLVVIDFWATWCGPCQRLTPIIEQLAEEYEGRIKVGKINVDDHSEVAARYNIMSIPNMKFFKGGQVVDKVIGAVPKPAMKQKFEANV